MESMVREWWEKHSKIAMAYVHFLTLLKGRGGVDGKKEKQHESENGIESG